MSPRDPQDSAADLPTLESAHALETVPGYTLVRLLAESTLARVYQCRAERTGEIVVVKVLTKETANDRQLVQRILRESRVMAGVRNHPHIARVIDVGEAAAGPYVAFEKLPGMDLRTRLVKKGRLPVADALAAVRDAAKALEGAVAVGVAHRDVKPSNLFLLDDGTVKLTDFGFAAPLSRLGGPENVYGTPSFVAPELIRGSPSDVRSDIYALGATLFQLVTARPLFEGTTAEVLAAHQKKPVPSIATMVPDAGIAVVDILYRLLHKDASRRPQTAGEVVRLLDEAVARAGRSSAAPTAPAPSEPQWPTLGQPSPPAQSLPSPPKPPARQERGAVTPQAQAASPFDQPSTEDAYQAQPTGVMGTLKQMSVTEIIQMLEIGKKSARIEVQIESGMKGLLHIHDGQLVFGSAGTATGEPAVLTLCQQKEGFFRIHYEKEPCEKNITRPTTFVLLEAMRQIDETASNPPAPTGAATSSPAAPQRTAPVVQQPPKPFVVTPATPPRAPAAVSPPAQTWAEPPTVRTEANVHTIGDGIQFHEEDPAERERQRAAAVQIDDVTLRETPTQDAPLQKLQRALQPTAQRAWTFIEREVPKAARAIEDTLEPLRGPLGKIHPRLGDVSPSIVVIIALGALFAVVFTIASALNKPRPLMSHDAAVQLIVTGHAAEVVTDLSRSALRTPAQDLALADAYAALHDDDRALALYQTTIPTQVDALALGFLISRLDVADPDPDAEVDLLVLWPDDEVLDALQPYTQDVRSHLRANAVEVLAERGGLGRVDLQALALLDLLPHEGICDTRRAALAVLRIGGRTRAALNTVERVGRANDVCFNVADVRAAYSAIKSRL